MKKLALVIIAVVVLGLGYGLISLLGGTDGSNSQDALDGFNGNQSTNSSSSGSGQVSPYTDIAASSGGGYLPYTNESLEFAKGKNTVLFFNAAWCPTCQVAKKNFEQNSGQFPDDLVLIDVDYDDNSDLRDKYGVRVQHTFVQIDDSGNLVTSWNGSFIVDQIASKLI